MSPLSPQKEREAGPMEHQAVTPAGSGKIQHGIPSHGGMCCDARVSEETTAAARSEGAWLPQVTRY